MSSQELVRVVNLPMMIVGKSPKDRVVSDPFQMAFLWEILTIYDTWDDPPSVPKKRNYVDTPSSKSFAPFQILARKRNNFGFFPLPGIQAAVNFHQLCP